MFSLEALEPRIAPAGLTILHPLPDIVAGLGKTGASVDLGNMFDASGTYHTFVTFHTNFDSDPNTPGVQGDITIELFDDTAPLNVQNFLSYVQGTVKSGSYTGTFFNRLVQGFVLQGGFFNTNYQPIPQHPAVHSEIGASNTAGTISMATVNNGPNTGTDAFFFNLVDNPSLDSVFTVFGKLTSSSMSVVNAIAALTPQAINATFSAVPTQGGYNPDPDSNPNTPPPLPTAAQLIEITGVSVTAPTQGVSPGIAYSITSITDAAGHPTRLVAGKIVGDTLNLSYLRGGAGVAKVTVQASDGMGNTATDTFTVTDQPNLVVTSVTDTLSADIVPGDRGVASVHLVNNTGGTAAGLFDVKIFLTPAAGGTAVQIGELPAASLRLASGGVATLSPAVQVPTALFATQGQDYVVSATITPVTGSTVTELFSDDNSGASAKQHIAFNAFGSFVTDDGIFRVNVPLTYVDTAGHTVVATMTGGGFGKITPATNGDAPELDLFNTFGSSALTVRSTGGHTTLHTVAVQQPSAADASERSIGVVNMSTVNLTADFFAGGGVKSLALGDLLPTDGATHVLQFGFFAENPDQKSVISLGNVTDYNFNSDETVASLKALSWHDVNATTEKVASLFMQNFSVTGDFEADFSTLTSWPMRLFSVGGTIRNSEVHIGGNVSSVVLGSISATDFLVGTTVVPTDSSGFSSVATVGKFVVRGSVQPGSEIAAGIINQISVGSVQTANSTARFGIISDQIGLYLRGSTERLANLIAGTFDSQGTAPDNYQVTVF